MSYIRRREEATLADVARLRRRLDALDGGAPEAIRKAEIAWLEAAEELDRVQFAQRGLIPSYRGRFVKCSACGQPFHDEGSFLAHWKYGPTSRIGCERTVSTLKVMGFVSDEYRYPGEDWPEYVLRHPDHETTV